MRAVIATETVIQNPTSPESNKERDTMKNRVVLFPLPHTHIQGDGMELKLGNSTILIDYSYTNTRTEEQEKSDQENLNNAMWSIADELLERGEAV